MFRKIVTELAYSPALAGNLGYYIKKLRDETSRRQIGLIFILLATIFQLFTAVVPPESANANDPAIFIDGGVQSINEYIDHYDQNTGNIMDLLSSLGITRSEIEAAKLQNLPTAPNASFWSMQNSRHKDNIAHPFQKATGGKGVAYYQHLQPREASSQAFVGKSTALGGWFGITKNGANLVTETTVISQCNTWLSETANPLIVDSWSNDPICLAKVNLTLSARAISSSSPTLDQLRASDRIAYTLSIKNNSDSDLAVIPAINLEDILEYTRILDYGGGEYNYDTRNLNWSQSTLIPQENIEKTFIVQALPSIPSTARGEYVSASYDCSINVTFGNTLSIPADCPPAKQIEQITNNLPQLSGKVASGASVGVLAITLFLYGRARQLLTELYIIRHNHLGGV